MYERIMVFGKGKKKKFEIKVDLHLSKVKNILSQANNLDHNLVPERTIWHWGLEDWSNSRSSSIHRSKSTTATATAGCTFSCGLTVQPSLSWGDVNLI